MPPDIDDAIGAADERRTSLDASLGPLRAELPLRYWRQAAHYTTPAANENVARSAIQTGTAPMARILERFSVSPEELATHLGIEERLVNDLLARPRRAPLVMLDAEDAIAPGDQSLREATRISATLFREAATSGVSSPSLRFFRPPGFDLGTTARSLYGLLWALAEGSAPDGFPLDGIVFPKLHHPDEVDLLHWMLDEAERALGLPERRIKVAYLVESAYAVALLAEIAQRAAPRICALVFGLADYSADVGLPAIRHRHPLADWARAEIVNIAGAVGVPAIDAMTLDFPVADGTLSAAANRARFLDRMALVFGDAVRAFELGMLGKWAGHPAQLFAVLLASDVAMSPARLASEAAKLEAYSRAVHDERGATIISGVMSDRATDRHARVVLRQATAAGRFEAERALALGVIDASELDEARKAALTRGGL